jgi:hypothetical protein
VPPKLSLVHTGQLDVGRAATWTTPRAAVRVWSVPSGRGPRRSGARPAVHSEARTCSNLPPCRQRRRRVAECQNRSQKQRRRETEPRRRSPEPLYAATDVPRASTAISSEDGCEQGDRPTAPIALAPGSHRGIVGRHGDGRLPYRKPQDARAHPHIRAPGQKRKKLPAARVTTGGTRRVVMILPVVLRDLHHRARPFATASSCDPCNERRQLCLSSLLCAEGRAVSNTPDDVGNWIGRGTNCGVSAQSTRAPLRTVGKKGMGRLSGGRCHQTNGGS